MDRIPDRGCVLKKTGRYDVSGLKQAQSEPGSHGRVLRNLRGIKTKKEMDIAETKALAQAMNIFVQTYDSEYRFAEPDIRHFHKVWLSDIYEWAGEYRNVNISKGKFQFARADLIPALMRTFANDQLARHTPCRPGTNIAAALAETHTELMLIHPFREGNGRVGRILAILMALQMDLPPLDFTLIRGKKKQEYFAAVRAGLDRNYEPMRKIFSEVIERSLSVSQKAK